MLNHRPRPVSVLAVLVVLALFGTACGGGGGDGNAEEAEGDSNSFTIWAPIQLKRPLDSVIARFEKQNPDIAVEAVYAPGVDLDDRLLLGERPDLYLATGLNLEEHSDGGLQVERSITFGEERLELIVGPGNPKQIADLSVFGLDPTTTTGLCPREAGCGRSARELLERARVTPEPDSTATPGQLVQAVAETSVDAALVYRTQAVKARRAGTIEYVSLPSTQLIGVEYRFGSLISGEAVDTFLDDFEAMPPSIQKILGNAGLAPLEGDPQ